METVGDIPLSTYCKPCMAGACVLAQACLEPPAQLAESRTDLSRCRRPLPSSRCCLAQTLPVCLLLSRSFPSVCPFALPVLPAAARRRPTRYRCRSSGMERACAGEMTRMREMRREERERAATQRRLEYNRDSDTLPRVHPCPGPGTRRSSNLALRRV